jgi:peptide/nickel transport system permease protein
MRSIWKRRIKYILLKTIEMTIILIVLSAIVFAISRLCPGNPLRAYYGDGIEHMTTAEKNTARENLGLNDPLLIQYGRWAEHFLKGDMGISYKYKQPVFQIIGRNVWNTLALGGISYILTFSIAIILGMFCALREEKLLDKIICKIGVVSNGIPTFFMALVLILIFSVNLGIFPTGGAYSYGNSNDFFDRLYHLVLPLTVMVLGHLWYYTYMVRNKLLEETRKDYVLFCKSQGFSREKIMRHHCLRNIMPSLLVIMAISLPHIIGGTYIVEMVFSYPGLGTLSFESARYQDYNMLMALTMITGTVVLFFNFFAQILSEFIDPRVAYEDNDSWEVAL